MGNYGHQGPGQYGPPPQVIVQAPKQGGALKTVFIVLATLFGVGALGVAGCVLCVGGTVAGAGAAAQKGEEQRLALAKSAESQTVALSTLLSDYKDNEVRADEIYKDTFITTTGKVGDVKKSFADSMYITVGTGKAFEIPSVQCSLTDDNKSKAASLSKGDTVTVKGKVSGLMMNVQIEDCMIVE